MASRMGGQELRHQERDMAFSPLGRHGQVGQFAIRVHRSDSFAPNLADEACRLLKLS